MRSAVSWEHQVMRLCGAKTEYIYIQRCQIAQNKPRAFPEAAPPDAAPTQHRRSTTSTDAALPLLSHPASPTAMVTSYRPGMSVCVFGWMRPPLQQVAPSLQCIMDIASKIFGCMNHHVLYIACLDDSCPLRSLRSRIYPRDPLTQA